MQLTPLAQGLRQVSLPNGLEVAVLACPESPGVSISLWYGVGARDEAAAELGVAHFLEHMMFKGSGRFGPGQVDRRTQALGGSNNAFTSHDATAYWFRLAPERWTEALEMEADRMASLRLDPAEVDSEREVVIEEISMYESDPWDALEQRVLAALWGAHPYARPVLGVAETLATLGPDQLRRFHEQRYSPDNALLVVAGSLDPDAALGSVEAAFGGLTGGARPRTEVAPATGPTAALRVERTTGELARLFLARPGPSVLDADHAGLRMLTAALGSGRASRLQRRLVDDQRQCAWISTSVGDGVAGAAISITAELHAGIDPARVEAVVVEELGRLASDPPRGAELERLRRMLLADDVFSHESAQDRALAIGAALSAGDLELPDRSLALALAAEPEQLAVLADRWLAPEGRGVVGWSLPKEAS